jgi:hypothetical protein
VLCSESMDLCNLVHLLLSNLFRMLFAVLEQKKRYTSISKTSVSDLSGILFKGCKCATTVRCSEIDRSKSAVESYQHSSRSPTSGHENLPIQREHHKDVAESLLSTEGRKRERHRMRVWYRPAADWWEGGGNRNKGNS